MSEQQPLIRLDSAESRAPWNYHAAPAAATLVCDARGARLSGRFGRRSWVDPLAALDWMAGSIGTTDNPSARWIGYLNYDLGQLFERLPRGARDDVGVPLFVFSYHEPEKHGARPGDFVYTPPHPALSPEYGGEGISGLRSNFSRAGYEAAVARAVEYIRAGDVFQVNLSQRFSAGLREQPGRIYERLRERFPARYGAYLGYGDFALLCNSPELFLQVSRDPMTGKRRVVTRPIKGTRPRRPGMEEELLRSAKDEAELNMIVDLERNDLGRVCEIGSVRVSEARAIESHPTVHHGVATVEGALRGDVGFVDLLRATFPGGSVTGAPKIRAMEIIDELEPTRRGAYCGAIGYLAADGSMEFNIAIRTMTVKDGMIYMPVGGGVVADSTPAGEYEETIVKARAMFEAVGVEGLPVIA